MSRRAAWAVACWFAASGSLVAAALSEPDFEAQDDSLRLVVLVLAVAAVVNAQLAFAQRRPARLPAGAAVVLVLVAYLPLLLVLTVLALDVADVQSKLGSSRAGTGTAEIEGA